MKTHMLEHVEKKPPKSSRVRRFALAREAQRQLVPTLRATNIDAKRVSAQFQTGFGDVIEAAVAALFDEVDRLKADVYGGPRDPSPAGRVVQMRRAA